MEFTPEELSQLFPPSEFDRIVQSQEEQKDERGFAKDVPLLQPNLTMDPLKKKMLTSKEYIRRLGGNQVMIRMLLRYAL